MSSALLIIDLQQGVVEPDGPQWDLDGVVARINGLADRVREAGGSVIFIQHDGQDGSPFHPDAPGWPLLPLLDRRDEDLLVRKTACDAFYRTELAELLAERGITRLIVTGSATDYCVDTTVRAAASRDYDVVVVADCHTVRDREHASAEVIRAHHNAVWEDLVLPDHPVEVVWSQALEV